MVDAKNDGDVDMLTMMSPTISMGGNEKQHLPQQVKLTMKKTPII
jgi:hypothetical protein